MRFNLSITIITFVLWTIAIQSTSKYEGVTWDEKRSRWQIEFDFDSKKRIYYFDNEYDAALTRHRVDKKNGILSQNLGIEKISNRHKQEKISQYKGVCWHKRSKKWYAQISSKGEKQKYGGTFNDEMDAAKRVNQLCQELGIPLQNLGISAIPNHPWQAKPISSEYTGVSWNTANSKWGVKIYLQGKKTKNGGFFNDELDAAKRVNQLCEEMGIPYKNAGINAIPNQQWKPQKNASQYKGVCWNKKRKKWRVDIWLQGGKRQFGGMFNDELNAAKRVNQLCEEMGIPHKNPGISAMPNPPWQPKIQASQYKGVSWNEKLHKWRAMLSLQGKKTKFGGMFNDELDAAKKVNQLCEEYGIPHKNNGISAILNHQNEGHQINDLEHANPVMSFEIANVKDEDDDGVNENKRKREKGFISMNDNSLVEKYCFYDNYLN